MYRSAPQAQILLLPPSLSDLIPEKDICRVVNAFVEALPRRAVEDKFPHTEGAPPFHPRLMLKALLYAYCQGVLSSRKIARACARDVGFMWLAAMQKPSHHTVNRFRGEYLADVLPAVLAEMAAMLIEKKYITAGEYFVDGTVLEADANKHSHVWRKNAARYKQRVQERAREILDEAAKIDAAENAQLGERDLPETGDGATLSAADIRSAAKKLGESDDARKQKAGRALEKEADKLSKYESQEEALNGRNSYSKTDQDATFMRTKTDALLPAYNAQAGVQDGYVTGLSVGQNANDASELIPHLESRRASGLADPPAVVSDSIYGTEENYAYLEKRNIISYLKYPSWHREQTASLKPYGKSAFVYDAACDTYTCPQGEKLVFSQEKQETTKSGYVKTIRTYAATACGNCAVKSACTKSETRSVQRSQELERLQSATRARLLTEHGTLLRKKRGYQIETVWAHLKRNLGLRRFLTRGLGKVRQELHLAGLAYNLRRLTTAQMASA